MSTKKKVSDRLFSATILYNYLSVLRGFLIGILSMQSWTATTRHGIIKEEEKDEKHTGKLFRDNLKLKGVS